MRRLRIAHTEPSRHWGGQEMRILSESKGLIELGHQVTLICPENSQLRRHAQAQAVPVAVLPIARKRLRGVIALTHWLKANRPEVISTHRSADAWMAAIASHVFRLNIPIVRTRHYSAAPARDPASRWLYRRGVAHNVTTGEAIRKQLIEEVGCAPERVTSVPTGVDVERFTPGDKRAARAALGLREDAVIIGCIGMLRGWKGHKTLVEAFAQLAARDAMLLIVGDGSEDAALKQQIASLRLTERVRMSGYQADVLPWLQAMDIFALASYGHEGVPQGITQALACALPVVATNVGGVTDVVQANVNGFVVEPRGVGAMKDALEKLVESADLRALFGERGRRLAQERWSVAEMLRKMEAIYQTAVEPRRVHGAPAIN